MCGCDCENVCKKSCGSVADECGTTDNVREYQGIQTTELIYIYESIEVADNECGAGPESVIIRTKIYEELAIRGYKYTEFDGWVQCSAEELAQV